MGGQEWVQESSEQVSAEGEGGAREWTDEPSQGRSDGPCDGLAAGSEAGLGMQPCWRRSTCGGGSGAQAEYPDFTSRRTGAEDIHPSLALPYGAAPHQPRKFPSACAGPELTWGAPLGIPAAPELPAPSPTGAGRPALTCPP